MVMISVIMPVYESKTAYLREAIESVLNQTYQDFEFLILNDSPTNKKLRGIIAGYDDERIKYSENQTNMGIPQSYNKLLDMAAGKYIAIMNHDDMMKPERLQRQYEYMEAHPEIGMLGTGYKKFGEINRFKAIRNPRYHNEICAYLLFKSSVHHPTMMLRRAIMTEHKIRYNENFISLNDRQLCYEFSKYSMLENIPDVLYKYRFHSQMTSKKQKQMIRRERAMFHKLWFAYNNIELTPEEVDVFDNYTTYGRQKIQDAKILTIACHTLENLAVLNEKKQLIEPKSFTKVCAQYITKRCLNALYYGHLNISEIVSKTSLPVDKAILRMCNILLGWRK